MPYAKIRLLLKDETPSWISQYKLNPTKSNCIDITIKKWLEDGVITFATPGTLWNSPLIVVPKKIDSNGTTKLRVCLDPRHINAKLQDDNYPLPKLRDILNSAAGHSYFTSLDLKQSFHQIEISDEDRQITAFTWKNVQYMFCGSPFGIKTLTTNFQRIMMRLFYDLHFVKIYVDDILVMSNTIEEHILHLKGIIQRLTSASLTLNTEKCKFGYEKLYILGYTISKDGIEIDKSKLSKINEFPIPTSSRDLQSFLGLANFFREFIPNYSFITYPLDKLRLSKNLQSEWTNEHSSCFETIKNLLNNSPILKIPDNNKKFIIQTDASAYAIGCVLFQPNNNEADSINFQNCNFIKFVSRSLNSSEQNYSASKRELLAIVYSLKKFSEYIYGKHFLILCDHKPLTYFHSQEQLGTLYET